MIARGSASELASARPVQSRRGAVALLGCLLALASACATPIGVDRVDHTVVYRSFSRSALSGSSPSLFTEQFLRRHGLEQRFADEPETVLSELHGDGTGLRPEVLFALSELSFLHAEHT